MFCRPRPGALRRSRPDLLCRGAGALRRSKPDLLRRGAGALVLAFLLLGMPGAGAAGAAARPNIVYIVADDLGWKDVGFHGSDIKTPNIDKLASEGVRFDQFYTQSLCTQSRAALMTGRYPFRYGLQTGVILSGFTYGLPLDEYLLPQMLKDAGYHTVMVGKWHLGHADKRTWPQQRGFDYHYGAVLGEIDYYTHAAHGVTDWYRDNRKVNEPGYVTQLMGADAVKQIETHDPSQPLFLYLAFTAPHAPYQAPKEYLARYTGIADTTRRSYAAMVTCMDDEIGKVLAALDRKRMRENTLIVFMSDNGGNRSAMYSGEIDMSKITLPADNGPYRDGKGSLYEGGTRVVAVANWPGHLKAGEFKGMMHSVDMLPTLADVAGGSTTKSKALDGLDLWPAPTQGRPSPRTEIVYNVEPYRAAVREGDWKLVWKTLLPQSLELFDLARDPGEKTNLAAQDPAQVAELQKRIGQLAKEGAPSLFLVETAKAAKKALDLPPVLPSDDAYYNLEP